jgi:hypothetical protein
MKKIALLLAVIVGLVFVGYAIAGKPRWQKNDEITSDQVPSRRATRPERSRDDARLPAPVDQRRLP